MNIPIPTWSSNLFDIYNTETISSCCCFTFTLISTVHNEYKNPKITCINCTLLSLPLGIYFINPFIASLSYQVVSLSITSSLRNSIRNSEEIVSDQTCSDNCYDNSVTALCPHLSLAQTLRQQSNRDNRTYEVIVDNKIDRD